ncbi:MAG: hypothetical protein ACRENU_06220 [Gemmatimonadaceae bacterium]
MTASNQAFIIGAYVVTWVVMLSYLLYLTRRGGRARAVYERMSQPNEGNRP